MEEHSGDPSQMWLSASGQGKGWLEFDLGQVQKVSTLCIWNYNDKWHTDRGVQTADLSVWTEAAGWRKVRENLKLAAAEGSDDYDEPAVVQLEAVEAQKVRLDNLISLGDADCVGLSKVRFFQPRGPQAARPSPPDGDERVELNNLKLVWVPGEGATAHNVYLGTDPENLQLLGKVTEAEAPLTRLADQTKYYWRADEIQPDGTTTKGHTWSFSTSGLLAWWKLDESEGQDVADSSPYGNAGTLVGNAKWQPAGGRIGGALELDGNNSYVQIANETLFDITDEITVAAWVKVRTFDKTWQTIIAKGDNTWRLAREGDRNSVQFTAGRVADGRIVPGNININDGQWHHIVGVGDANAVYLYVDGVLDNVKRTSGKMKPDDEPVYLGENSEQPARGRFWNGWIDDVRVYNYALTAAQVKAAAAGGIPLVAETKVTLKAPPAKKTIEKKLVAWWKFDESEGAKVADSSGNRQSGMLVGEAKWSEGKIGGALEFDGEGDYVDLGNQPGFNLSDEITVAAWIKVRAFNKGWQTIVAKGDYAWRLARDRERDALQFAAGRFTEDRVVRGNISVNDGKWHHVVGVGTPDTISLYVDGVLDRTVAVHGNMQIDETPASIGENSDPTCRGRYWNGWIDELSIFTYALGAEEVKALYAGQEPVALVPPPATPVVAAKAAGPPQPQAQPVSAEVSGPEAAAPQVSRTGRNVAAIVVIVAAVGLIAGVSTIGRRKQAS